LTGPKGGTGDPGRTGEPGLPGARVSHCGISVIYLIYQIIIIHNSQSEIEAFMLVALNAVPSSNRVLLDALVMLDLKEKLEHL